MQFTEAFAKLMGFEGDYSNDPADPGGETRFGVTLKVARLNGYDGPMKDMPLAFAQGVYIRNYWNPLRLDEMPPAVRYCVFDAAVNSGVAQAAKWLQRAVGAEADGAVGPKTVMAVNVADPRSTQARMLGYRLELMAGLARQWPVFGRGWTLRVADLLKGI